MLVIVVGVAVAGWLALRDDSPPEPAAFLSPCGTVVEAKGVPLLRVVLIGDSIMAQPSCELARALAPLGIETHMHAISGSGLLDRGLDWKKRLDRLLVAVHPDVVLALFVGNYIGPPALDFSGQPIEADTPLFDALWQEHAAELSNAVRGAGAKLFWVEPPPMRDSDRAARLFGGYTQLGDLTLPSGRALAGPSGEWVEAMEACGGGQPLRAPDGVHLTDFGAQVFALVIAHDLTTALGLSPVATAC